MSQVNDFAECLQASHEAHDLPLWKSVYEQSFPDMVGMHCHRDDGDHQRLGIDRSVVLNTGKTLWIDEKVRGRNKRTNKVYSDIALEYVSNDRRKTLGWVCKPLMCDYIAYAIAPLGRAYLMPVPAMQAAWRNCSDKWFSHSECRQIAAANHGYNTLSLCVPPSLLFPAIGEVLRPTFPPLEVG